MNQLNSLVILLCWKLQVYLQQLVFVCKSLATKDLGIEKNSENVAESSIVFPQFPTQSLLSVYSDDGQYITMHIEKKRG